MLSPLFHLSYIHGSVPWAFPAGAAWGAHTAFQMGGGWRFSGQDEKLHLGTHSSTGYSEMDLRMLPPNKDRSPALDESDGPSLKFSNLATWTGLKDC